MKMLEMKTIPPNMRYMTPELYAIAKPVAFDWARSFLLSSSRRDMYRFIIFSPRLKDDTVLMFPMTSDTSGPALLSSFFHMFFMTRHMPSIINGMKQQAQS